MIEISDNCPLAGKLAARLREAREELTRRWLDRIVNRAAIDPNRVFPTEDLLDHVPLLVVGIADYLEDPTKAVAARSGVVAKAMELGALRHKQGFDEHEILKEYEIFGGILFSFVAREAELLTESCSPAEMLVCGHRLFHAVSLIQQATLTHFLQLVRGRLGEREDQLRGFNRAVTHELKNRIGAAMGAAQLLDLPQLPDAERQTLVDVILRNISNMRSVLDNLLELTHLEVDTRQHRRVTLPQAAAEAARQLRDLARASGVDVRMRDLPPVEVPAAAVELTLTNFLSNAIKYADRTKPDCWVEIRGRTGDGIAQGQGETVVEVIDNGLGVPADRREHLFERFYRAHTDTRAAIEGTGLGLSIVRDAIQGVGGRVWAQFPAEGSVFAFALPSRRTADQTDPGRVAAITAEARVAGTLPTNL
ncbi:MAG: hypothetical protein NVS1B4_13460 [Gemmatimonadaceae bacterium]